eukprot:8048936-Alexandrium_andersonii.AAC.1
MRGCATMYARTRTGELDACLHACVPVPWSNSTQQPDCARTPSFSQGIRRIMPGSVPLAQPLG